MIGIVLVSHSATLAEGVRELASQMVQGEVAIALAAGVDDPENPIGTNAEAVYEAIESVYSDEGVLILMDLGSAVMSAELALEFLEPEKREHVLLCGAPLVEGAVTAAIQASIGSSLHEACREAEKALAAKQQQLPREEAEAPAGPAPAEDAAEGQELTLTIRNRLGLHARPAAQFVTAANRFSASIRVYCGEQAANAKSINEVATLGARQGSEIRVVANGADAGEALDALEALVESNFGEAEEAVEAAVAGKEPAAGAPAAGRRPAEEGELAGIPASPGVAIGPVAQYRPHLAEVEARTVADPEAEWERLQEALEAAREEIAGLRERTRAEAGETEASIFEAHALFLQDPALLDATRERIFEEQLNAEAAWEQEVSAMAARYRSLEDEYMQARAADLMDVEQRVLRFLMGMEAPQIELDEPSILIAADLTPSDTARMEPALVLGICTEVGGATSHSAILARAFGIPAVVGVGPALQQLENGESIALDGAAGRIWLEPDEALLERLREERAAWLAEREATKAASQEPAKTKDGEYIEVAANIGGPNDADLALEFGAEGVGLFRTEFLFLGRDSAPDEAEQYAAYRRVAETMGQRPVIIRTLDIGGDKPLPYLPLDGEANPFLGWRGIRFCLDHPDLFKPQLRAILRAGHEHNVKLMLPMVSAVSEVRAAKELLQQVKNDLRAEGLPFDEQMSLGIMIEVPASVAIADHLAAEVDFFSVGTNDLTQYVMAADRGNARVANLADALQPAVLRLLQQTTAAAHAAGIWVGICGELAGDPQASPILVGLGLDELSMNPPAIPAVKAAIANYTSEEAHELALAALEEATAAAVRALLA